MGTRTSRTSPTTRTSYSTSSRSFVSALGHSRVALVGNSIGGGLCLLTALERPEIVSALVLASSGGLGREVAPFLAYRVAADARQSSRRDAVGQRCRGAQEGVLRPEIRWGRTSGGDGAGVESARSAPRRSADSARVHRIGRCSSGVRFPLERLGDIRAPTAHILGRERPHHSGGTRLSRGGRFCRTANFTSSESAGIGPTWSGPPTSTGSCQSSSRAPAIRRRRVRAVVHPHPSRIHKGR